MIFSWVFPHLLHMFSTPLLRHRIGRVAPDKQQNRRP
jgi:hypothetical protein